MLYNRNRAKILLPSIFLFLVLDGLAFDPGLDLPTFEDEDENEDEDEWPPQRQ